MVNSKKMSKSTVAIVLLSLLLVLSLILTATGAWFTYTTKNDANGTDGKYTFRDGAMSATIGEMSTTFGKVMRGTEEVTDHADVMPGDVIKGGSLEVSFEAKGEGAYIVYRIGNGAWKVLSGADATAANLTASKAPIEKLKLSVDDLTLTGDNYDNTHQGTDIDVSSIALGAVEIRMIQVENLSAADAFAKLTADSFQANKA